MIGFTDEEAIVRLLASTRTFYRVLRGAIQRHQLLEDLFGFLRTDVLLAAGVTFSTSGATPKPGTPTFEKVMGRKPVPLVPSIGGPKAEPEEPVVSEKAQRARAMLAESALRKKATERKKKPTLPAVEESPTDA